MKIRQSMNQSNRNSIIYRLVCSALMVVVLSTCRSTEGGLRPQTGIKEVALDDGRGTIQLIATGQASERAIELNSPSMKQSTSCQAAKDLLRKRLGTARIEDLRTKYIHTGVELLYANEYCRISGLYNEGGLPEQYRTRAIQLDRE
ncbi:MAG: hypothetical protein KDK34_01630 [Leptospiraceae bacterium]|nr:hypothetical protein [Leptospiraceae bacterium]